MATQRRMIYAQLAENKDFALMSDKAQKTYIFLIVLADDEGRVKGDSDWLRIKIFPYNPNIKKEDMQGFIKEIVKSKLIVWYKSDNNYFIQHPNWTKYQILRTDRMKKSTLPQPDDNQMTTKRVRNISKLSKGREGSNNSLSFLKNLPKDFITEILKEYDTNERAIREKAKDLMLWCETNGKLKKNYKAFLLTAIRKDFTKKRVYLAPINLAPEETIDIKKNEIIQEQVTKIKELFKAK